MEFVTDVCCSNISAQKPQETFVEELMNVVLKVGESERYKELIPMEGSRKSECPVIRSFLLQFLLEIRYCLSQWSFLHEFAN